MHSSTSFSPALRSQAMALIPDFLREYQPKLVVPSPQTPIPVLIPLPLVLLVLEVLKTKQHLRQALDSDEELILVAMTQTKGGITTIVDGLPTVAPMRRSANAAALSWLSAQDRMHLQTFFQRLKTESVVHAGSRRGSVASAPTELPKVWMCCDCGNRDNKKPRFCKKCGSDTSLAPRREEPFTVAQAPNNRRKLFMFGSSLQTGPNNPPLPSRSMFLSPSLPLPHVAPSIEHPSVSSSPFDELFGGSNSHDSKE